MASMVIRADGDRRPTTVADRAVIVFALLLPTAITWLYFIALDGAPALAQQAAYAIGKVIQFGLPIAWVCFVQRERLSFGLPKSQWMIAGAVFGALVAAGMAALYLGLLKPGGYFDEPGAAVRTKVQSFGAASPQAFLMLGLFYSALHSLLEEYYWRWFAFRQLARWQAMPLAVAISAVAFTFHHVLVLGHYFGGMSVMTWLFAVAVATGGVVWAWLYWRSGSLHAGWLSHGIVDAAIFAIGYDIMTNQH